jgi:uncharacterized protein (DUF1501 family)
MITRRVLLRGLASGTLLSLLPDLTIAAAPGDKRLVVILLRGAMDGLDVVYPVGDPELAKLRPGRAADGAGDLDGYFAVNPALHPLLDLYRGRQLSFLHAVATPYRNRSHFEGQDILEQGGSSSTGETDGWLNRLLGLLGTATPKRALDAGSSSSLILQGRQPYNSWYPEIRVELKIDSLQFLEELYRPDPLMSASLAEIRGMSGDEAKMDNTDPGVSSPEVARLVGRALNGEARIATFSIPGWDTHINQDKRMPRLLENLTKTLLQLKDTLGKNWDSTVVVVLSEFGRTARLNGTRGTDHGTGGLALLAGGPLANGQGGKVLARWPTLSDGALFEHRDLMPTEDVRRYVGWVLARLFDLPPSAVATRIFPGLDMGSKLPLI